MSESDYQGRNLVRYEGSVHSAVGVVLFFFGIATLFPTGLYLAMGDYSRHDLPLAAYPLWGIVAIPLGLFMRRRVPPQWLWISAIIWLGIAIAGGMFVVPLYAFLTTFVPKTQTARTIAANNIVNSGAMVVGSLLATGLSAVGLDIVHHLLLSAGMCLVSAYLGLLLLRAERAALA